MARPPLQRIEELFHRAADLGPEERAALLEAECAGDSALRAAVENLLRLDDGSCPTEGFIASPIERTQAEDEAAASTGRFGQALALVGHTLDDFELIEVVGSGGMGVVYKARQLSLGRLVALKMLWSGAPVTAEQLARFRSEAEALARLQHPNIVQIYAVGEHEGRPYLVMEYVPGPNLARYLDGHPQPAGAAAELVEVLAGAIQAVHARGLIHRDLKPANILLRGEGRGARDEGGGATLRGSFLPSPLAPRPSPLIPKITDFGLAKRLDTDSRQTKRGTVLGTPSYMAPEQARGRPEALGPAIDIYALGALLYEVLTGRPPFEGASPAETVAQLLAEEPISPARLRPTLPRDLVTICLKCLEKDPRRRYAQAADLAADLRRFLAGEPIRARRVGVYERVWRWCRRRPLVAALTATCACLAVALVSTIVLYQARLEKALAETEHEASQQGRVAEEEREELAVLGRMLGDHELEEGDAFAALVWLTVALHRDKDHPEAERRDRLRIALVLQHCPRLVQCQPPGRQVAGGERGAFGRWMATLGEDRVIQVRDVLTDQARQLRHAVPVGEEVRAVAMSPDGRYLALAGADGSLRVWDLGTGQPKTPPLRLGMPVQRAALSDDNQALVVQLADRTVQVWDLRTGGRIPLEGAEPGPTQFAGLSTDGRCLVTLTAAGVGRVWRLGEGKAVAGPPQVSPAVSLVALRGDGRQLAVVDADNALRVWEPDSGKGRLLVPCLRSEGVVRQVHWSPDGRRLLTVGGDNRVRVWDAGSGTPVTPPLLHAGRLQSADFAGGDTVVTVGDDGSVEIWELTRAQEEIERTDAQAAPPDLLCLAQQLSGRRLGAEGRLVPLEIKQLRAVREKRRAAPPVRAGAQGFRGQERAPRPITGVVGPEAKKH